MRIVVDYSQCESHAICMSILPQVFEVRDDDLMYVLDAEPPESLRPQVEARVGEDGSHHLDAARLVERQLADGVGLRQRLSRVAEVAGQVQAVGIGEAHGDGDHVWAGGGDDVGGFGCCFRLRDYLQVGVGGGERRQAEAGERVSVDYDNSDRHELSPLDLKVQPACRSRCLSWLHRRD